MPVPRARIASDGSQTNPGPNGGAPVGNKVSTAHNPNSAVDIKSCNDPSCIKDWFEAEYRPFKKANELPVAPNCGSGNAGGPQTARDSVMLKLRLRAPSNALSFSFSSFFLSAEYPEYVCSSYNDQFIALVTTPGGAPQPIPNPVDKNLMVYNDGQQKWPIGINIAYGTNLFAVCEPQNINPGCWDQSVSVKSCKLGDAMLAGTGYDKKSNCDIGGGTYWLTTHGNVIPGDIVELRIAIWDVGDAQFDSLALIDGFKWQANATIPGTE
ncbi:MAG: choice-of-anchor L domain-containing protein [Deltaproteobacteria bacterium]|nr:choice-of-anchor L domain-containing protein [Deltaproteobacteria bacterium]